MSVLRVKKKYGGHHEKESIQRKQIVNGMEVSEVERLKQHWKLRIENSSN